MHTGIAVVYLQMLLGCWLAFYEGACEHRAISQRISPIAIRLVPSIEASRPFRLAMVRESEISRLLRKDIALVIRDRPISTSRIFLLRELEISRLFSLYMPLFIRASSIPTSPVPSIEFSRPFRLAMKRISRLLSLYMRLPIRASPIPIRVVSGTKTITADQAIKMINKIDVLHVRIIAKTVQINALIKRMKNVFRGLDYVVVC